MLGCSTVEAFRLPARLGCPTGLAATQPRQSALWMCAPEDDVTNTDPVAAPNDEEMTPKDYAVFVGYIGGFVAFFYAIAALVDLKG